MQPLSPSASPSGDGRREDSNELSEKSVNDAAVAIRKQAAPVRTEKIMPMFVAVLTVEFSLDGNDNLKAKRRVANSLKQKARNTFNVAVAEAGTENSLTRLRLAVVSISNSESHLRSRMDKCCLMLEAVSSEEMIDSEVEIYAAD